MPAGAQNAITITMNAQNNSGESGTATLTPMGNQTKVDVNLTGAPAGPQPAHIHPGTCANLNPNPKYPLTSLTNGKSETIVNVSLTSLMTGDFAINVHKSPQEISVYVSCGDISAAAQTAPATGHPRFGGTMWLTGGLLLGAVLLVGSGMVLRRRPAR